MMKVKEIMSRKVESCAPDTNLASAAMIMWRNDCGVVPVVHPATQKTIGVVTDRDICMALATRHRKPGDIRVDELMSGRLVAVHPEDDVHVALDAMRVERVRRVPVLDQQDVLAGMLSINDLVLAAEPPTGRVRPELSVLEVMNTLKAICGHQAVKRSIETREPVAL